MRVLSDAEDAADEVCGNEETLELVKKTVAEDQEEGLRKALDILRLPSREVDLYFDELTFQIDVSSVSARFSNNSISYVCSARVTIISSENKGKIQCNVHYTVQPSATDEDQFDVEVSLTKNC